jgi:hypothetical protein
MCSSQVDFLEELNGLDPVEWLVMELLKRHFSTIGEKGRSLPNGEAEMWQELFCRLDGEKQFGPVQMEAFQVYYNLKWLEEETRCLRHKYQDNEYVAKTLPKYTKGVNYIKILELSFTSDSSENSTRIFRYDTILNAQLTIADPLSVNFLEDRRNIVTIAGKINEDLLKFRDYSSEYL